MGRRGKKDLVWEIYAVECGGSWLEMSETAQAAGRPGVGQHKLQSSGNCTAPFQCLTTSPPARKQEPWTCKLIPHFPFDLLPGASQLVLLPLVSAWPHPSPFSPRPPIPAIHPISSMEGCIQWATLSCTEKRGTTGNVG